MEWKHDVVFYLQDKNHFHPLCLCTVRFKQIETNIFRHWKRNVETHTKNRFPSLFFTSSHLQCADFSTSDKYVNFWLSNLVTSFWISGISDTHQYAGMGIEIQLYLRYGSKSVWFIGTEFLRAYQSNSSSSVYTAGNRNQSKRKNWSKTRLHFMVKDDSSARCNACNMIISSPAGNIHNMLKHLSTQ